MPLYPGDRVPDRIQRENMEREVIRQRLQTAGKHVCHLLDTHFTDVMAHCEHVDLPVLVPNGQTTWKGNSCFDRVERDAWRVWAYQYRDEVFDNPESWPPRTVTMSNQMLLTLQKQLCMTDTLPVRDHWQYNNFLNLREDATASKVGWYLSAAAGGNTGPQIDALVAQIERRIL